MFDGAKGTLVMLMTGVGAQRLEDVSCVLQADCFYSVEMTPVQGPSVDIALECRPLG